MTDLSSSAQLGELKVNVKRHENGKWAVQVLVFKANTLRGDAYWVTREFKVYAKESDARKFAARFN